MLGPYRECERVGPEVRGVGEKQKMDDARFYAIRFRGRPRNLLGDFVRYVSQNKTIPGSTPELSRAKKIGFRGPTPESTRLKKKNFWQSINQKLVEKSTAR